MAKAKKQEIIETRLEDYKAPAFFIDEAELDFDLSEKKTKVKSLLRIRRNPDGKDKKTSLFLNGEKLELKKIKINGVTLGAESYELSDKGLTIPFVPDEAVIEIENTNAPVENTALSGLYKAGPLLCTQCESEGFRRITYFIDRPDVQCKFRIRLEANKNKYPVLLSNGNLVKKGVVGKSKHYAIWEDPHRKPCYLFALVAGKMDKKRSNFTTKSGRKVLIEIYTEPGKSNQTSFAMDAIKKSMAWDEKRYGLEYDLDRFMIVAVSTFNAGAMENKGLNIFNDSCVLGRAETATDSDIEFFERVVAHEYFHNWTGDRVTCRDWFQLSLKEGLTVFREQEFCGDMNGRALERIHSVSTLRRAQFPEDAGAMAHPIRPHSYQSIDNFYTATVYEKGAEVVRMIQTLVGQKGFRKGMNLYFKRHDGQSATCENFVDAMADANDMDLSQFMLWYSQAGTPTVKVRSSYDAKKKEYTLRIQQKTLPTAGQKTKKPLYMPFSLSLLDEQGKDMKGTFIIDLMARDEDFVFLNAEVEPVPSLFRDFSAPVNVDYPYTDDELILLMGADADPFNRWDAGQKILKKYILSGRKLPASLIGALKKILQAKRIDDGTKAAMLTMPSETELGLAMTAKKKPIDPIELYKKRQRIIVEMAENLSDDLWSTYETIESSLKKKDTDGVARGQRSLKHLCLAYLAKVEMENVQPLAFAAATDPRNMTDLMAGLHILCDGTSKAKTQALDLFAKTYKADPVVMDNWLSAQALARHDKVLRDVKKLMKHPAFELTNPNRVSALIGAFIGNPLGFHAEDGSGYVFVGQVVAKLDKINPSKAARLMTPFLRWRDFTPKRQKLMRAELKKLDDKKTLSANVREIVSKALARE